MKKVKQARAESNEKAARKQSQTTEAKQQVVSRSIRLRAELPSAMVAMIDDERKQRGFTRGMFLYDCVMSKLEVLPASRAAEAKAKAQRHYFKAAAFVWEDTAYQVSAAFVWEDTVYQVSAALGWEDTVYQVSAVIHLLAAELATHLEAMDGKDRKMAAVGTLHLAQQTINSLNAAFEATWKEHQDQLAAVRGGAL